MNKFDADCLCSATVSFGYGSYNRRTSLTLPNGVVVNYSYDLGSQLSAMTYNSPTKALGDLVFTYDLNGRRTGVTGNSAQTALPSAVSAALYNANNQLTQWGSTTLAYDTNGNMTSDGTNSFTWDARNHLISMNQGGSSFAYDAVGRRIAKSMIGTATNYLYDGANHVQELAGTNPTANLLVGGVDEYFARTDSNGTRNYLTDPLGSTVALTDSTGAVQTQYSYDPFGNTSTSGATSTNAFQYAGRENEGNGLYYYRARYYNPTFQRFISEDPLGFGSGDVNLYAYVADSPLDYIDPFGASDTRKDPPPNPLLPMIISVNSCAANLSQYGSLHNMLGVPEVVGSNMWGDMAGLLTNTGSAAEQGEALGMDGLTHALPAAAGSVVVDTFTSIGTPLGMMPGTYNPVTVAQVPVKLSYTTGGEAAITGAEILLGAKAVLDAGVYVGALVDCSLQ